ncbi:MAG: NnrU family protein [Pseudomonadales bacterium]|jgi:uncharacterized membrane protein
MIQLLLAGLLFLGTHLGVSSSGIRGRVVAVLGERGYLFFYSVIAVATLAYLIWLYNELPRYDYLWLPSPGLYLTAELIMPAALVLAAGSFMIRSPTAVGGGALLTTSGGGELARGVGRITRHPFQWGVLLWAVAHVVANGDTNSVIFFASLGAVAGLGTLLMDRRRAATFGEAWRAYAAHTSNVPFLAIVQGRNRLVFGELWLPLIVGGGLYVLLLWGHRWVSGVRIV